MTIALLLALSSVLSNERVAVTDGTDTTTHSHDAVVVDLKARSARFVKQGEPLAANDRSIVIDLLAPPEGALPNPQGLRAPFDRPSTSIGAAMVSSSSLVTWGMRSPYNATMSAG